MNIDQVLSQLDSLFASHQVNRVEHFIKENLALASEEGDHGSVITLMNELIGHYREMSEFDKAVACCDQLRTLLKELGFEGTVPYATSLLNIANACRAAGLFRESMTDYQQVLAIYQNQIADNDFRYASLFNNMSLLFQEMGDYESAVDCLQRALGIALLYEGARIEVAVTYTNLAASQLKLKRYEEAIENLDKAFSLFEMDEDKDYHYSGALSAMAEAQYLSGNLEESVRYYKKALSEIERTLGKNKAYEITKQNLNIVLSKILENTEVMGEHFDKGLALCEAFYKEYGVPMIRENFPEYESMIAAGLVGEGSDCFGFDDEVSRDHDFGPGFCLWLTDAVYDEIGEKLQKAYDTLPKTYMGITRYTSAKAQKRVGVFRISDFYEGLIGMKEAPTTNSQWLFLDDDRLAAATNGKVFRDDLGEFTRIRESILNYYPEDVRLKKIAREAALMAQSGQYNYSRMLGRNEAVTAQIALAKFTQHTMAMIYLLNRKYAPYYKWMHLGLKELPILKDIRDLLTALANMQIGDESIPGLIEEIVARIITEMKKQSLTSSDDNYLDHHTDDILKRIPEKENLEASQNFKKSLIREIVELEWEAFDQVKNEGGRADCQNDFQTFSIMRTSQYYTWTEEMLKSYIHDFRTANAHGWNLITEKYGRMMESTAPDQYAKIKDSFPVIPSEKKEIIEEIVKIQVSWMEDFSMKFPKAADQARSIHTSEDNLYNTSYETYLRGELSTYSDETLDLYGRFIASLYEQDLNLAELTMRNTAILYGYESLEDLEQKL